MSLACQLGTPSSKIWYLPVEDKLNAVQHDLMVCKDEKLDVSFNHLLHICLHCLYLHVNRKGEYHGREGVHNFSGQFLATASSRTKQGQVAWGSWDEQTHCQRIRRQHSSCQPDKYDMPDTHAAAAYTLACASFSNSSITMRPCSDGRPARRSPPGPPAPVAAAALIASVASFEPASFRRLASDKTRNTYTCI